jgi:cellulose synthase/poly-beta-1,6-N-acetylglucosamine synthase-like glycosyltransferase
MQTSLTERDTQPIDRPNPGPVVPAGQPRGMWCCAAAAVVLAAAFWAANVLDVLLMAAIVIAALRTVLVLVTAAVHVRRSKFRALRPVDDKVTVIIPACEAEAGIEATVRSALASYHSVAVIVVDHGSTDAIANAMEELRLRRVKVIRRRNAGKAAAINAGLAAARTEYVVFVDGDTLVEPGTVGELVRHFADATVGAVSGNVKVGNHTGLLGGWQHIENVTAVNFDRRMFDVLECAPAGPGVVGAFRRSAVLRLGGVPAGTMAEDTDLTMALERAGWRVVYEQEARVWTEAPASLDRLWKQQLRSCQGMLQAMWKHRRAVFERGAAGRLGRRGIPYLLVFQVFLPLAAPFVDVAAVAAALAGDFGSAVTYWLVFLALQAVPAVVAFGLDEEPMGPLLVFPVRQLLHRQLMCLVVLRSLVPDRSRR